MKHQRQVRLITMIAAISAILGACSQPVDEADAPGTSDGDTATAEEGDDADNDDGSETDEVGDDQVRIVYWSMFSSGEPLQEILEEATERFMDENPNIVVDINWAGRDVLTQLQSAVNAGEQVDIVDHSSDRVLNAVVLNDLALNLDDYMDQPAYGQSEGTWLESFEPGLVEAFTVDDSIYIVPREAYVSGLWYDKSMMDELGIEPSATGMEWDEFVDILDRVQSELPDVSSLGADGAVDFYNNWWFSYLSIRLAGVDGWRDAAYDESGESWREPEFLQAAEMVRELQDRDFFQSGFEGSVWPSAQQQWAGGDVAMMLMGAWLPKEMEDEVPEDFEIGMFAFPNVPGGNGNDVIEYWSNGFSVLESTDNPDAAVEWVKYITSPEGGGAAVAEAGYPVALRDTPKPPTHEGQFEALAEYETMAQRGGLNDDNAEWVTGVLNLCDDQFFKLELSPQEFIDCLATESAAFYN